MLVAGTVALVAVALFAAASRATTRTAAARVKADAEANGVRIARALVDQVEVQSASDSGTTADVGEPTWREPVVGGPDSARLVTACDTPNGWAVGCVATLRLVGTADTSSLIADVSTGERIFLRGGLHHAAIQYLATAVDGGRWTRVWGGRSTPVALAVTADADTMLLLIGARQ